ncbi:MAG TPA: hypothetical protein VF590_00550, partial [Isosphaeraceae bacterium]
MPTDAAAPAGPTRYTVGGTLRYTDNGQQITITLAQAPITVLPNPQLNVHYFHQRDVFSDDPFTDVIEPSQPYSLAVLVKNDGAGEAKDLTITSARPKIVENEKGLLVDFQIVATEVAGQNLSPSLTAEFGTIAPGQSAIGRWLFTSSIQGRFIDYSAIFEHVDGLGDPRLSIIKSVDIHELIHIVDAGESGDARPDFLVNDDGDEAGMPDAVYFSDATIAPVSVGTNAVVGAVLSASNLSVTASADVGPGWSYVSFVVPSGPAFRLVKAVRSDGQEIPRGPNLWTTDRSFVQRARRPVYEDRVHIFDRDSTGTYTLVYEAVALPAVAVQQVGQPVPNHRTAPLDTLDVTFSRPIDPATLGADDLILIHDGSPVALAGPIIVTPQGGSTYRLGGLAASTAAWGDYTVSISAAGVIDTSGQPGAAGAAQASWSMGERAPYVRIIRGVEPGSIVNVPVDHLTVEFSIPVDPASFTAADLTLARDGGPNLLAGAVGVTITPLSETRFRIDGLTPLTQPSGAYRLGAFGVGVATPGGTAGVGGYDLDWTNDTAAPLAAQDVRFAPDHGVPPTDGRTNTATGAVTGTLPQPGVTV